MAFWHKSAYEIKRYFRFNRSEKNGIIIVIVLIFLSWMGYYIYTLVQKNQPTDFSRFEKEIVQFQKSLKSDTSRNENKSEKDFDFNFPDQSVVKQKLNPFPFNPNRLPIEKWKELGLNKWQIKTILN